jgi:transcriptional regulator with XRE-family HTH domain
MGKKDMAYTHPQQGAEHALALRKKAGAYLRRLRESQELTQVEIAESVGFRYSQMVGQIESGKVRLPPDKYVAYAKALKVDPNDMVRRLLFFYDPFTANALFVKNPSEELPTS